MSTEEILEKYKNGEISKEELAGLIASESDIHLMKIKHDLIDITIRRLENIPNFKIPKAIFSSEWNDETLCIYYNKKKFSFVAIRSTATEFITFSGQKFSTLALARVSVESELSFLLNM